MISQLLKGAISHSAFFVFHLAIKGIVGHINSNEELKRAPVCLTRALVGTNSQMVGPKKKKRNLSGKFNSTTKIMDPECSFSMLRPPALGKPMLWSSVVVRISDCHRHPTCMSFEAEI